jgi:hypothetical protein
MTKAGQQGSRATLDTRKSTEQIQAERLIYSAIQKWTGMEMSADFEIPMWKNGKYSRKRSSLLSHQSDIKEVLEAARETPPGNLGLHAADLKRLVCLIEDMLDLFAKMQPITFDTQERRRSEAQVGASLDSVTALRANVVMSLGVLETAALSLQMVRQSAKKNVAGHKANIGRPIKDNRAHALTLAFAKLYLKVTGKFPTYADSKGGPTGDFSPRLEELFENFNILVDIRSPIERAIKKLQKPSLPTE